MGKDGVLLPNDIEDLLSKEKENEYFKEIISFCTENSIDL